jgi:hypothetical protein
MMRYFIALFLTLLFLLTGCSYSCEAQKHADQTKQHIGAGELRKLSPDLSRAYNNDAHNKRISVLVRTTVPLSPEQRMELNKQNVNIGTASGNVFTAEMQLKDVPSLAEKPYVRSIELSKKLNLLKQK